MRVRITLALLFILFCFCSKNETAGGPESVVYPDAVTFDMQFGNIEGTVPDEYLIAQPRALGVGANGEILVLDESKIKVYDRNGGALRIVGGPGQGPGEFENPYRLFVGPDGHVTIKNIVGITLLTPDFEFIEKKTYVNSDYFAQLKEELNWQSGIGLYAVNYSENERVVLVSGNQYPEDKTVTTSKEQNVLVHELDGVSRNAAVYTKKYVDQFRIVSGETTFGMSYHLEFFGDFLFAALPGRCVVYIDTGSDFIKDDTGTEYTLTVQSLNDGTTSVLTHAYEPEPITKDDLPSGGGPSTIDGFNQAAWDNYMKDIRDFRDRMPDCAPLRALIADGNFLFAFTFTSETRDYMDREVEFIFTDVFDMSTGEYICSTWFPGVPRDIEDGRAYYLKRGSDEEFPAVACFTIDGKVYGKEADASF